LTRARSGWIARVGAVWRNAQAGIEMPRTTYDMENWGCQGCPEQAKPGDILAVQLERGCLQHLQW